MALESLVQPGLQKPLVCLIDHFFNKMKHVGTVKIGNRRRFGSKNRYTVTKPVYLTSDIVRNTEN